MSSANLPAVRVRGALDVRTPAAAKPVQAVPPRRTLGAVDWFIVAVIVFVSAGGLLASLGTL